MQSTQRVETGLKAIESIWQEIFDTFVTEVVSVIVSIIDTSLEGALTRLKSECEGPASSTASGLSGTKKRPLLDSTLTSLSSIGDIREGGAGTRTRGFEDNCPPCNTEEREPKRRRLISTSSQNSTVQFSEMSAEMNFNVADMLREMETRIEKQARSIETLTMENHQVRLARYHSTLSALNLDLKLKTTLLQNGNSATPREPVRSLANSPSLCHSPSKGPNTAGSRVYPSSAEQLKYLHSPFRDNVRDDQRRHQNYVA
jgi:hypothetical protein